MKQQVYKFGEFSLDTANRRLRRGGETLTLLGKAFDLLQTLLENSGRLVGKDELFSSVWRDQIVEESNLTVHISQIRKALGETKNKPRFIETVPGYGYRFIGDVEDLESGDEIIIETETLSRITIEKSDEPDFEDITEQKAAETVNPKSNAPALETSKTAKTNNLKYAVFAAVAVLICLTTTFVVYFFNVGKTNSPFEKTRLTRLTNSGKVSAVTLSPDGKFIAYVLGEPEGSSLWVRQTGAANDTRILPPVKAEFWDLTFTPDAMQIYYNLFYGDKTDNELFRIPTLGGVPQKVPNVIAHSISFSPDGKRFAYIQPDSASNHNYLIIADANGSNQQIIAKKPQPNTFVFDGDFAAWSPDGESVACLVNRLEPESNYNSIISVNVSDGTEKLLSSLEWREVLAFEWLRDGSGLLVSGSEKNKSKNQIWFVPKDGGEIQAVTNDLTNYSQLEMNSAGTSFIALQTSSVNGIYVGEATGEADSFKEIVSEVGSLNPLVWTPDGKIVFRSAADGSPNLWIMDADGVNRRQLTADAQVDERGMCISPDGKFIVFVSWRSGKSNLWRMDADGKNLIQLTDGLADAHPQCSPDGKSVIFQRGILSQPKLWKISIEGGEPAQLTDSYAKWGAISTDGKRLSFFQMFENKWRIGIIPSDGGAILQRLDIPGALRENDLRWSPDNRSLFFIATDGNVGNVWNLPLEGGEMKPVTNFKTHYLEDFAFSADGTKLAVSRNIQLSDAVLIERAE